MKIYLNNIFIKIIKQRYINYYSIIFIIMSIIDDTFLKKLLETSVENFKNELITHKVSKINCNFINYIIYETPENIKYLDEYYKYFNQIDINIIKNTRNSQGDLLVDFYQKINQELLDKNTKDHISFFLKTHEITNNIIDLFSCNFSLNKQNINMVEDNSEKIDENYDQTIYKIKCDIDKNRNDIIEIKHDIEKMQNDINHKINKLLMFINPKCIDQFNC